MKQTTNDWLLAAEDDLLSANKLATEERLTNIVAFHCQQCLEKSFKALIEELNLAPLKSHDLIRLCEKSGIVLSEKDTNLLAIINEVYIDARYPGDIGLMPQGKPTLAEVQKFIRFSEVLFIRIKNSMKM